MIRLILGLILIMGAVGGMEDPNNSLVLCMLIALLGLAIMALGVSRLNQN